MCLKNSTFLDILLKVKTYRFADIAIILRENLVEMPKKYRVLITSRQQKCRLQK
jgi:hypothetical protein